MLNKFLSKILILSISILLIPSLTYAQGVSSSKGRVNALTYEYNESSHKAIAKIRELINERNYESAANRSITFIKGLEGNSRNGIEKSVFFQEAYNSLCVSATGLGKVEYAMDACETSLQLTPKHWESLKARGTLYFISRDYDKALADFRSSLENSPNDEISTVLRQNISVVEGKLN